MVAPALAGERLVAIKIISGEELTVSNGRTIRLQGIKTPGKTLADEARNHLEALTRDTALVLENEQEDRYGRINADVYAQKGKQKIWLQGELIKAGLAFVYSPLGDEIYLEELMGLEKTARMAKQGLWAEAIYADLTPESTEKHYGEFAFVSGKVLDAVKVKGKTYLNFGPDWRTDFTVAVAGRDARKFKKAKIDLLESKDQTIRVRGWIKREFGPMIVVTDPVQVEMLTQKPSLETAKPKKLKKGHTASQKEGRRRGLPRD